MLPSKLRISKSEFKTLGRGISQHSPLLFVIAYKKSDQTPSQFSFICSKKVSKSAVKRNLLRRRGYNAVGKILPNIQSGYYFVFNFKKESSVATYADIQSDIESLIFKYKV